MHIFCFNISPFFQKQPDRSIIPKQGVSVQSCPTALVPCINISSLFQKKPHPHIIPFRGLPFQCRVAIRISCVNVGPFLQKQLNYDLVLVLDY